MWAVWNVFCSFIYIYVCSFIYIYIWFYNFWCMHKVLCVNINLGLGTWYKILPQDTQPILSHRIKWRLDLPKKDILITSPILLLLEKPEVYIDFTECRIHKYLQIFSEVRFFAPHASAPSKEKD